MLVVDTRDEKFERREPIIFIRDSRPAVVSVKFRHLISANERKGNALGKHDGDIIRL